MGKLFVLLRDKFGNAAIGIDAAEPRESTPGEDEKVRLRKDFGYTKFESLQKI